MWKNKDVQAIKDHTARKTGDGDPIADVGDAPLVKGKVVDIFRNKKR